MLWYPTDALRQSVARRRDRMDVESGGWYSVFGVRSWRGDSHRANFKENVLVNAAGLQPRIPNNRKLSKYKKTLNGNRCQR